MSEVITHPHPHNQSRRSNTLRKPRTPLVMGIATIVAVFVLAVGGYWAYIRLFYRPTVPHQSILPADTIAYLTVDPSPPNDQKEWLDRIVARFKAQPGFDDAWARLLTGLTNMEGTAGDIPGAAPPPTPPAQAGPQPFIDPDPGSIIGYTSELKGKLTIAVLAPTTEQARRLRGAGMENTDVVAAMKYLSGSNIIGLVDLNFNPEGMQGPASDLKYQIDSMAGSEPVEKYRGIAIYKYNLQYAEHTGPLYFALLEGTSTAVVGGEVQFVREVIDRFRDGPGLSNLPIYESLVEQVPPEPVAALYVNFSQISSLMRYMNPEAAEQNLSVLTGKLWGAVLVTLTAHQDGLQIDVASDTQIAGTGLYLMGTKPDVASLFDVPQDSLAFVVGTDLGDTTQLTINSLRRQPDSPQAELVSSALEGLAKATGLDPQLDIIPLLKGDYMLSVSTGAQPGLVFQLKLDPINRGRAQQVLDKLVRAVPAGRQVESFDSGGGRFYTLALTPVPQGPVLATEVWGDRLTVVYAADTEQAKTRIGETLAGLGKGFGRMPGWRAIAKHLPDTSNAIAYADVIGIRRLVEGWLTGAAKLEYERYIAPLVRPVNYILIGSVSSSTSVWELQLNHTVLFVGIAP